MRPGNSIIEIRRSCCIVHCYLLNAKCLDWVGSYQILGMFSTKSSFILLRSAAHHDQADPPSLIPVDFCADFQLSFVEPHITFVCDHYECIGPRGHADHPLAILCHHMGAKHSDCKESTYSSKLCSKIGNTSITAVN